MFECAFNFPNISWTNRVSSLEYNGSVTDKVRQISDQYGTFHFKQIKYTVSYKSNSVLDLVFSNSKSIKVEKSPEALMQCNVYHPAIVITCTCLSDIPILNEQHSYRDSEGANYERVNDVLGSIKWDFNLLILTIEQSAAFFPQITSACYWSICINASFPPWVTKNLKNILAKKKQDHKIFK